MEIEGRMYRERERVETSRAMLLPGQRLKRCPGYVDYDLPGRIVAAGYAEQR